MGVLSDLIVGNETDAEEIVNTPAPSQAFGGVDIKGIDTVKLATLHSIVTDRTPAELRGAYEPTATASHGEAWLIPIPAELVSQLAALNSAERRSVAERWSRTDEFQMDQWNPQTIAQALDQICNEATKASSSQRTLFLWMSL